MATFFFCVLGMLGGAFAMFMLLDSRRRRVAERESEVAYRSLQLDDTLKAIGEQQQALAEEKELFTGEKARLAAAHQEFQRRVVSYKELQDENAGLKRDLLNVYIESGKLKLDRDRQQAFQEMLHRKAKELGSRYLKESVKWISNALNQNNFSNCKQRLLDVIGRCRGIGFDVPESEEAALLAKLKEEYEMVVRAAFEREEQARIKAQIREEQLREKEIERELKQLEREREAIKVALEKALAEAHDQHSEEVERLRARLAEAEARTQRAISNSQLTKSGYVYVISNIGSFGEGVFKVGMTRRDEPSDRIKELSNASVPFPYDVHMMIRCNDAPTLENALHRAFHRVRINKANPRKEFFKTDIATIAGIVKQNHGEVQYVADVEALEYRQSLDMPAEDQDFIEDVYHTVNAGAYTADED